jgi:DNA-binding MarR family transcriptional regulator
MFRTSSLQNGGPPCIRRSPEMVCMDGVLVDNVSYDMRTSVDIVNNKSQETADDVFESIHTVMHLFRSAQYHVLRDGPHDLTHMEFKVLGFFARNRGATQSDLVAYSGRDKGQLARLISSLKGRGLLRTRADEEDHRSVHLHLTSDGRAVHQTLQRQGRRVSKVAVTGLSVEERRRLVALLHRVKTNLEKAT